MWMLLASWSVPLLLIYSLIGFFKSKTIFKKLFFFLFSIFLNTLIANLTLIVCTIIRLISKFHYIPDNCSLW